MKADQLDKIFNHKYPSLPAIRYKIKQFDSCLSNNKVFQVTSFLNHGFLIETNIYFHYLSMNRVLSNIKKNNSKNNTLNLNIGKIVVKSK